MVDGNTDSLPTGPADHLTLEEKERLLASLTTSELESTTPGRTPRVSYALWSGGQLVDITCSGCGGNGCNRCEGRGFVGAGGTRHDVRHLIRGSRLPKVARFFEALRVLRRK